MSIRADEIAALLREQIAGHDTGVSTPVVCCAMSLFLMPLRGLFAGDELHYSYRIRGSSQA